MPTVPAIGEITICELHRAFLTTTADGDTEAQEAYSKILGRCYPSIPYRPHQSIIGRSGIGDFEGEDEDGRQGAFLAANGIPSTSDRRDETEDTGQKPSFFKQLTKVGRILSRFQSSYNLEVLKKVELFQGVSWHKHKQCLAFLSGADQVVVYDFGETGSRDPVILASESQKGVAAIAWRPNAGMTLSVACRGGVCIWTASYPGSIAPVRSGIASFLGAPSGSTGARWALVDFLSSLGDHPVTSLAWSPSGRLLASASWRDSGFMIWDVAQGTGTPLRRGFGGVSLLQWSAKGDYLFSAKLDAVFHLWETDKWSSEKWSSSGGPVVSAMWSPDDAVLLIAFDQTTTLGALHFAAKPPSLDAQLLPVELLEIESITGGRGQIEKMVWDYTGERLAVSFSGGDDVHAGLIAIYDTRKVPILAVSLLGFVRGPGSGSKALAFAFYHDLRQGVLLAVCWSTGMCCTYPLIFK